MFQKTEILWTSSICSLDLEKAQKGQLAATSIIGYAIIRTVFHQRIVFTLEIDLF